MRLVSVIVVSAMGVSGLVLRAQAPALPPAPLPQATFRAGVDIVTFDVTVLDKDRKPVRGLTGADFTVTEEGKPRPIVAFTAVDVPGPPVVSAPWMREVASDVVSNAIRPGRLVMILMDDASTSMYFGAPPVARDLAIRVIDELGPADLAAVAFTRMGRSQNFTQDRAALRAAIASFSPKFSDVSGRPLQCVINHDVGCTVPQVALAAKALLDAPAGRKTLIYIGPGGDLPKLEADDPSTLGALTEVVDMFRDLQRANVTVYTFDPDGLQGRRGSDGSRWLAENTGGRAVLETNAPEAHVSSVMGETAHYYLLGFQSTTAATRNRDFRRVQVRVNRPDVEVRARNGYYAVRDPKPSKKAPPAPIDVAVAGALPNSDLALGLHVLPFAAPNGKDAEMAIVVRVTETVNGESSQTRGQPWPRRNARVLAVAYDDGYSVKGSTNKTMSFRMRPFAGPDSADRYYELLSRLPIKPGRYELRVAVEVDGRVGSAYTMVEVPAFEKTALSLSSIAISRTPAIAAAPSDAMHGLVPIVPTAVRDFAVTDAVEAFLRIYQRAGKPPADVLVRATITDQLGKDAFARNTSFAAAEFTGQSSKDYRLALPTLSLAPGPYLLTIAVTGGDQQASRQLRFTVQ